MDSSFKFSSLGATFALSLSLLGCGTGTDDANTAGTGGSAAGTAGTSSGGSSATGGSAATGGASTGAVTLYGFDVDAEPFTLNNTASSDPMYQNLGDADHVGDSAALAAWTGSRDFDPGTTSKGCLMLSATFTGWNQSITVEASVPVDKDGAPPDLTNKTLRAQVFLEKGLSPFTTSDAPGGVVFFIKSGASFTWGQAPWTNLDGYGAWKSVKFNTDNPDPGSDADWDPSNPVQMGFQLSSGGGNMHTADEFGPALETVVCIDNISVQDN